MFSHHSVRGIRADCFMVFTMKSYFVDYDCNSELINTNYTVIAHSYQEI